jgi:chemotaxis protein CheC
MTTGGLSPLTDLERDALGELANLAMARAAMSLRQMVHAEVLLSVPTVEIMSPAAAADVVSRPGNPSLVAIRQDFSGPFAGRALLIFHETTSLELVRIVVGRQLSLEDIVDLEDEALAETGNIILNSWVSTLANLLKQRLSMSLPMVVRHHRGQIFESADPQTAAILFLHIRFETRQHEISGYVALMMDIPSIEELRKVIAEFVASVSKPPA